MQAYVYHRYGGPEVVELADVPKPTPADHEVLVKVYATTVTAGDWRMRTLEMPKGLGPLGRLIAGIRGPRQPILGTELSGVIETIGKDVTRFAPGDEVFAFPGAKMGSHAQYRAIAADGCIAPKPSNLSFEEAAALPFGGTTALHYLRKADIKAGEKVLVVGASGNVGTMLVQLATHLGAHVTGITSTRNVELVASLGAERVIDYTKEDYLDRTERYDVIIDTVGERTYAQGKRALTETGRWVPIAAGLPDMLATMTPKRGQRIIAGPAQERPEDIRHLGELAESGALRPIIDQTYPWTQMREAHAHTATRHKRGTIAITVISPQGRAIPTPQGRAT